MAGRILVIDDAVEVVDFFRSLLGQFGHEVIAAHDGESGLRKFYDELPDLVFLDLLLPRRDGSDVCAEIKRSEHGLITPVAIITGVYKNQSKIEAMRQHGVVDYLIKPMPAAKITALVDWALGDKPEEETTPDEDFELLRLQPAPGEEAAPIGSGILPGFLARAEQERASGVLFATRGKTRKALLIEDGRIVGARSNAPVDRIDRVLLAMRKVTPLQMSALRSAAQVKGDALAAAVLLNFIDQTEAHDARRFQAITTGLSLFRWSDGAVRFTPGETLECPRLDRPVDPARLTLIGLRKNPAARQAVNRLQLSDEMVIMRPDERACALRDSDLARREREVFDLVDGRRSVFRLRQVSVLAQLPVDDVLSVLVGAGVLKVSTDAASDIAGETFATASGSHHTGSLESVTFAELLGTLARERANGVLVVEGRFRRRFVFQAGDVVHGRSSNPADMLGEILMQQGAVSRAILEEALQTQRDHRPDRRIGSLLFEMGALSLSKLEEGTRAQLLRVLESTFAWTEGVYIFEPAPSVAEPSVSLGMNLPVLLRRGIATMSLDWLERRWCRGPEETILIALGSPGPGDDLAPDEREVLALAAHGASIERIVAGRGREALFTIELLVAVGLAVTESRPRTAATATLEVAAVTTPVPVLVLEASGGKDQDESNEISVVTLAADEPVAPLLAFLRDEVLAERREAEREVRRLSEEVGRLGERLRGLAADRDALDASRRAAETGTRLSDADLRALEESNRSLLAEKGALEAKVHQLEMDHRALAESNRQLEKASRAPQAEKGALEAKVHQLEMDHRALAESNRQLEKASRALQAEKAALEAKQAKRESDQRALEARHHKLETDHRALAESNRQIEKTRRALEESSRTLQADKVALEAKHGRLEADHRALDESRHQLQEEKGALEEKNRKLAADNRVLAESNRGLAADKGVVESRSHKLEADHRALEAKAQALEAEIRGLRADNRALELRNRALEAEARGLDPDIHAADHPPAPAPEAVPVAAAVEPGAGTKNQDAGELAVVIGPPGAIRGRTPGRGESKTAVAERVAVAGAAATAKPRKSRDCAAGRSTRAAKSKGGTASARGTRKAKAAKPERELVEV